MHNNFLNLVMAIITSVAIIFGWRHFYEMPRLEKLAKENEIYQEQVKQRKKETEANINKTLDRSESILSEQRVSIKSSTISGSISLRGLRFDDITLLNYKKDLSANSESVELFSPSNTENAYFAEIGWVSKDESVILPNNTTLWNASGDNLTAGNDIKFTWKNPQGIIFEVLVSLDENYLFTINQSVKNTSNQPISVQFYGLINRSYNEPSDRMVNILHQGMVGSVGAELKEYSYDKLKDNKREVFEKSKIDWLGITDKYWLAAFIPDQTTIYSSNFTYAIKAGKDKYQADFISPMKIIEPGENSSLTHRLFSGAKKVDLLDKYEEQFNIALFDRAIDFGWFYVLTKPIFNLMNFFYNYVGNFGISIMIVTVLIKLALFSLANKSYRSMKNMKALQPQIERLKALYEDDKARLNQEIMELYRKEKINPVSGCLPMLVQIPVFFSIYKVLYVTIEMRHAPFYGWIKDLSAPDPTTIFNLFGLLPFGAPTFIPAFLQIGIWPIIMAITMFLHQRMSPEPADPVQAQVIKLMPLMFLFMFATFPAGLLIYWSWNNILSIIQQTMINKLDK